MIITGTHRLAYKLNCYQFKCPPVSTFLWDDTAWCFYIYAGGGFRNLSYCLQIINQMYINEHIL